MGGAVGTWEAGGFKGGPGSSVCRGRAGIGLTVERVGGLVPLPSLSEERSTSVKMVRSALATSTMLACPAFLKAIAPKHIMREVRGKPFPYVLYRAHFLCWSSVKARAGCEHRT